MSIGRVMTTAFATLLAVSAAEAARTPTSAAARKESLKQWLDGPIHYVITPAEIKEYKSLKTDTDRGAFIERFWRRRDPTPMTLVNEYRQLFWTRVREADEKFLDSPGPGWMTDRGKIYILYGPPDEIGEDVNAVAGMQATDGKGFIRWTYLTPGGRNDVDPVVHVPFVRDVSGEWKLSYDPRLSSLFFTWQQLDDNRAAGMSSFLQTLQHGGDPIEVMLDLGKLQEVPPQETILLDSVETVETFAYLPLSAEVDRFQPPGKPFLAVITAAIPGEPGSDPPSVLARVARKGAASDQRVLGEGSFRIEGDGPDRVAQARVLLSPDTWDATVLSVEPVTGVGRIFRTRIEPLGAGDKLRLSDLVLASSMAPLPYAAQASYESPYIIGGFRVTPKAVATVGRGNPVQAFFEIYGGAGPFQIAYQLEGREQDGRFVPLGKPQQSDATERGQGYALDTSPKWPAGAYRLSVTVRDASGESVSGTIPFTLVAN
jgi:GWxTD domain-containing protein